MRFDKRKLVSDLYQYLAQPSTFTRDNNAHFFKVLDWAMRDVELTRPTVKYLHQIIHGRGLKERLQVLRDIDAVRKSKVGWRTMSIHAKPKKMSADRKKAILHDRIQRWKQAKQPPIIGSSPTPTLGKAKPGSPRGRRKRRN